MDPAIGASTWALGSHRWTENIGSLTRNPARAKIQNTEEFIRKGGNIISSGINNAWVFDALYTRQNTINMGRDAVTV